MITGLPVVVDKITGGHLKSSSKVIARDKSDLTKNIDQVFVSYH